MINLKNILKRRQIRIWIGLVGVIILAAALASYLSFTGFVIGETKFVEQTVEIEVWADSYIEIGSEKNQVKVELLLDNGTILFEEIEFYLSESLFLSEIKSEGISLFNLSEVSPGTYPLRIISQGSPVQYINPTSTEKKIEISENREIKIFEEEDLGVDKTNQTIELNQTNDTIIFVGGTDCEEFKENVLWSSGYSNKRQGSTNYQTWHLENNCSTINKKNCFLGEVKIQTRFISMDYPDLSLSGEGYVQISDPDESICGNPENAKYSRYLAYEILQGEEIKEKINCGKNKNENNECEVKVADSFDDRASCYGIKTYGSQYLLTDVFKVDYTLCWEGGENES